MPRRRKYPNGFEILTITTDPETAMKFEEKRGKMPRGDFLRWLLNALDVAEIDVSHFECSELVRKLNILEKVRRVKDAKERIDKLRKLKAPLEIIVEECLRNDIVPLESEVLKSKYKLVVQEIVSKRSYRNEYDMVVVPKHLLGHYEKLLVSAIADIEDEEHFEIYPWNAYLKLSIKHTDIRKKKDVDTNSDFEH